ncbi:MAG: Glucokinase [Chlamydiae bacterium]|nr:Glucokinase [Chlamydiota bacterium]
MWIAGDIGGTKAHLALFEYQDEKLVMVQEHLYKSQEFKNVESLLKDFIKKTKAKNITSCTLGIAGPVVKGIVKTPNLPWIVDRNVLQKETNIENVHLLNDLEAVGYGIFELDAQDVHFLTENKIMQEANCAVIAAGTGLGEACIYFDGKDYKPFATEGGHSDFAPRNEEQMEYLQFMQKRFDHVSYERVLSGAGLVSCFEFFVEKDHANVSFELQERMSKEGGAKVISELAQSSQNAYCERALNFFVRIYGQKAGNMALSFFATGGVYIVGGIAPKIVDALKQEVFMEGFLQKGRMEELLAKIPVVIVLNENAALLGAAHYAKRFV